jgi:UDP-N-acetylmuramate--alanine ligase
LRVVIAGGGTGGHLFPGLAVARALKARMSSAQISFAGTATGIEARVIPSTEFELDLIRSGGLKGKSLGALARGLSLLPLSALDAWRLISRRRPDVVIGVGGYSSGPVVGVAVARRIPTLLMEQNAMPGMTNRLLARVVQAAAVTYEASLPYFGKKGFVSGNPIRKEFLNVDDAAIHSVNVRVLVVGGSQGAHAINVAVAEAAPRLAGGGHAQAVSIVCQTGTRDFELVGEAFQRSGVQGRVERFIDAMDREVRDDCVEGRSDDAGRDYGCRKAVDPDSSADRRRRSSAQERRSAARGGSGGSDRPERSDGRNPRRSHSGAGCRHRETQADVRGGPPAREARRRRADRRRRHQNCGTARIVSGVLGHAKRIHFIGIGGIGMSGIAELLVNLGYEVSGSDTHRTDITDRLESMGARIAEGHDARNLGNAEVVVYSSAVRASNPEMEAARDRALTVVPRADLLAELMQLRQGIAVAGAHGKTTTTSMIALVLEAAGLDPTAVIGGRLSTFGSNARLGQGKYLVAEADESDRSFLRLSPRFAVITNIDREHLEAYRDFDDLQSSFVQFANLVPGNGGVVILCADDPYLKKLRPAIERPTVGYGFDATADITAVDVRMTGFGSVSRVQTRRRGGQTADLGALELAVPGRHNVLNALAAIALGRELGIAWSHIAPALAGFHGAERRFEVHGEANGVTVVEDYAHHPTEIAAVIAAAKPGTRGRLIVAFQPHRYSRTQVLMEEFGHAFAGADVVVLTDIYAASEDPIPGVDLEALAEKVGTQFRGDLQAIKSLDDLPEVLARQARPNDLVLLLGAGSIGSIWRSVLRELEKGSKG